MEEKNKKYKEFLENYPYSLSRVMLVYTGFTLTPYSQAPHELSARPSEATIFTSLTGLHSLYSPI